MSRWGPKATTESTTNGNNHTVKDEDLELIDQVEWASEENPLEELAARPKPDKQQDPCGCPKPPPGQWACKDMSCVLYACQEECRSNCEAGDKCANRRLQNRQWKELQVIDAGKKGKGLIVLEGCEKGDLVAEYVGRAVNKAYLPRLFSRYAQERKLYIMALDKDIYLDARKKGGLARYINHSCEPNCVVERWKVRGIIRAAIIAVQDIPAGTELSFDYKWDRKRGRAPTKCHCGAPTCRGTLEVARSLEEEALENKLRGHWKKPLIQRAGKEIVNRSIQILSQETQEYYSADVTQYDETTGKHLVMYRHDLEEVWEDLKKEDWMILDEEAEQFIISKKKTGPERTSSGRSLLGDSLLSAQQSGVKCYIYVQTPIKEAFWSKHLIERCQRSCRVTITPQQFAKPPLLPDPRDEEELEKYHALDNSLDGTVWKLSIAGTDIYKAHSILERNVTYLEKKLHEDANGSSADAANPSIVVSSLPGGLPPVEVVIPRSIVDLVKKRLPLIRERCRSVNITFVPSESKSKQFAKLILEGSLQSDIQSAKETLWMQLVATCVESNAPLSPQGIYKDLGFFGGELSSTQFQRLLDYDKMDLSMPSKHQDAKEDLTRRAPFFTSFESTQRCTIWVQSDFDKGRIDGSNRIVNEATPNAPRKIYFGCDPKEVPKLWGLIQTRALEVARGVKYLYLGSDRLYQPYMMRNGGQFFEYVRRVTGASVTVDSMTGDHLRIDGKVNAAFPAAATPTNLSDAERAALAEELIRLQIELYRDHCIREQNWIFGRDWTLVRRSTAQTSNAIDSVSGGSPVAGKSSALSRLPLFDARSMSIACMEIAEITSTMSLGGSVAAHAVVILYRFVSILSQSGATETTIKIRELVLACCYLANKAQKVSKWRKLEEVLKAAYNTFYPGAHFDRNKEEVLVLEEKVIMVEAEILSTLDYDVFWRGFDWIVTASTEAGEMSEVSAKDALRFSYSGPVLAAGPDLWLKYGAEYVFAAAASFLETKLDALCSALSLIPLKVSQAAELIANSVKLSGHGKKHSSHPLFGDTKKKLMDHLPRIKSECVRCMSQGIIGTGNGLGVSSESEQRYRIIGSGNRKRRVFRGVETSVVKDHIMPVMDGVSAESNCSIFIEKNMDGVFEDIVLEGSWRAIAIAAYLLQKAVDVSGTTSLLPPEDAMQGADMQNKVQAKGQPGLLQMKNIETSDGWAGTIQSQISSPSQSSWGRKTGGKCCVAAKLKESALREVGLRWWIPPRYGPSPSGSICDMFLINSSESDPLSVVADLTLAFVGQSATFSMLTSHVAKKKDENGTADRFVAVSLQRWPSEKVASKELEKEKRTKGATMQMGFSAAALQEMQLLSQLHSLIRSPRGHPNFILPTGVALPSEFENGDAPFSIGGTNPLDFSRSDDDIFSLSRSSEENEIAAQKERRRKDMITGPHLVFQPTPFVLQRFMSRKKRRDGEGDEHLINPLILSSWFHDLLSALVHCHTNNVVLRTLQSDQIVVDHSGVAKLGGLYRATLNTTDEKPDILELARARKAELKSQRKGKSSDEDFSNNPFAAPEMLLGSPKHTKETDIWAMGCLLANLLLSKPLFVGKDRETLLTSVYKVVGTPTGENFKLAAKFPYYVKPDKKKRYKPGVEKAMQFMLKGDESQKHAGAIDLLGKMLHLDPERRITAVDALRHNYMLDYTENSNTEPYRQQFVQEWMILKKALMRSSNKEEDEIKERERGVKRKAMLIVASKTTADEEDDDLYDMNDILVDDPNKKPKG